MKWFKKRKYNPEDLQPQPIEVTVGALDVKVLHFVRDSGYDVKSIPECLSIIERDHLDVSQFELPNKFSTFDDYVAYVRAVEKRKADFKEATKDIPVDPGFTLVRKI